MVKTIVLNGVIYLGGLLVVEALYNSPDHTVFGYSYAVSGTSKTRKEGT